MSRTIIDRGHLQERDLMQSPAFEIRKLDEYDAADLKELLGAIMCAKSAYEQAVKKYPGPGDEPTRRAIQALDVWSYRVGDAYRTAKKKSVNI